MRGSVVIALIALAQAATAQSNAETLASNLKVTLELGQNFGHGKVRYCNDQVQINDEKHLLADPNEFLC